MSEKDDTTKNEETKPWWLFGHEERSQPRVYDQKQVPKQFKLGVHHIKFLNKFSKNGGEGDVKNASDLVRKLLDDYMKKRK